MATLGHPLMVDLRSSAASRQPSPARPIAAIGKSWLGQSGGGKHGLLPPPPRRSVSTEEAGPRYHLATDRRALAAASAASAADLIQSIRAQLLRGVPALKAHISDTRAALSSWQAARTSFADECDAAAASKPPSSTVAAMTPRLELASSQETSWPHDGFSPMAPEAHPAAVAVARLRGRVMTPPRVAAPARRTLTPPANVVGRPPHSGSPNRADGCGAPTRTLITPTASRAAPPLKRPMPSTAPVMVSSTRERPRPLVSPMDDAEAPGAAPSPALRSYSVIDSEDVRQALLRAKEDELKRLVAARQGTSVRGSPPRSDGQRAAVVVFRARQALPPYPL
jgi:hypothetical protein